MCAKLSDVAKAVLGIDCALGGCLVAVKCAGSERVFSKILMTEREQAAQLVPMVQDVMAEAGVGFADVGLIVTTVGPGSFTGLRIGLSTARAFGLARDIPVQGVGTMDAMAASCAKSEDTQGYFVALETKRSDFYVQGPVIAPACVSAGEIEGLVKGRDFILCGDAVARLLAETGRADDFSEVRERGMLDPVAFISTGLRAFMDAGQIAVKAEPVYLRGADVSMSNKLQRQIKNIP